MKKFDVKSDSDPNKVYTVRHFDDGPWSCTCPGFTYRGYCKHVTRLQQDQGEEMTNEEFWSRINKEENDGGQA